MKVTRWLKGMAARIQRGLVSTRRARCRPLSAVGLCLEPLEDRTLLSAAAPLYTMFGTARGAAHPLLDSLAAFRAGQKGDPGNPLAKVGFGLASTYAHFQQSAIDGSGIAPILAAFANDASDLVIDLRQSRVLIEASSTSADPALLQQSLATLGFIQTGAYGRLVSGWLPIDQIESLSKLADLRIASGVYSPQTAVGSVTSQGDQSMRADIARSAYGVDGTGIMVGVLSDSFNALGAYASNIATGDLPAGVQVLADTSGTDEGRAMAQIVHDVAPGASLAFATAFTGQAAFANNIVALANAGAKVITDDVIYFAEPFFQNGVIAQAVNTVASQGVSYFSAAGNQARQSYEAVFAMGSTFANGQFSNTVSAPHFFGGAAHDFDPGAAINNYQSFTLGSGVKMTIDFQWDQPFASVSGTGSANDVDIYVLNAAKTQVVGGSAQNSTAGDPVELFAFTNTSGSTQTFNMMIVSRSGPAPGFIKYVNLTNGAPNMGNVAFATNSGSNFGHSNATGAAAVGAAYYVNTPRFGVSPPLLNSYSSSGGTRLLFADNGTRLATPLDLHKVDFVAPDGGSTTVSGFANFFGTSAAAPHAAGVAALMKQSINSLTPAQIIAAMASTAIPMANPFGSGYNYAAGAGLIQADAALNQVQPPIVGPGPASHFQIALPGSITAGANFPVTVTALDTADNTATGYTGTVHFTSSDGQAILPADSVLTDGIGIFNITFKTAGGQQLTAADTAAPSIAGTSSNITVVAAAATHLAISTVSTATAGAPIPFTVNALDAFNNIATGYAGTLHFTSSDGQALLPADGVLINGIGTFAATLKTAGSQRLTAADTAAPSVTGTSNNINVAAAAATRFAISAPASILAGTPFGFTVAALDAFNNTATGYRGTANFAKSDNGAGSAVPGNYAFVAGDSGVHTFANGATFVTASSQTLTATDLANPSITGSATINVNTNAFAEAHVNFQPASAPIPSGYAVDSGLVFGARGNGLSYGWNVDLTVDTRDRNAANAPDQRYDTLIHMRNGFWEMAVPNGTYSVHLVAGDPSNTDSIYKVNVEGVLAVNGTPTVAARWVEGTVTVMVSDGKLTVTQAADGVNAKLDFIDITATAPLPIPPAPTGLNAAGGTGQVVLAWNPSSGAGTYRVYRGTVAGGENAVPLATGLTTASYTDTVVNAGTTYYYKVSALNTSGESPLSSEAFATPTAPAGFAAHINFQPASAPVPAGYLVDSGLVFAARGNGLSYGWNADLTAETRDRNAGIAPDQRYDTLIHMRSGFWEMAVPNGTYSVHLVAGDASNIDSVYKVNVEGVLAVNGTPTTAAHWVEGTVAVTVSDGRLTLTQAADGINAKLDFIDIASSAPLPIPLAPAGLNATGGPGQVALTWIPVTGASTYSVYRGTTAGGENATPLATGLTSPSYTDSAVIAGATYYYKVSAFNSSGESPLSTEAFATAAAPPSFTAHINFQPAAAPIPAGYVVDSGLVYGARGNGMSFGWNVNLTADTRDRNDSRSPDQRYDTLIHMRSGFWEIAVPNGSYSVHVVAGDPSNVDTVDNINVEGILAVSGAPTSAVRWVEGTVTVTVSDGRLTVTQASGAVNVKLNYIDITAVAATSFAWVTGPNALDLNHRVTENTEIGKCQLKHHAFQPILEQAHIEVNEQASVSLAQTKVGQQLCLVNGQELVYRLEFDHQVITKEDVHDEIIVIDDFTFVNDR